MTSSPWTTPGIDPAQAQLLDTLPCLLWVLNAHGDLVFVNHAFTRHAQRHDVHLTAGAFADALPDVERNTAQRAWHAAEQQRTPFTVDLPLRTSHDVRWFRMHAEPGELPGLPGMRLATLTDIHEHRSNAAAARRQTQQLETLNRLNQTISAELDVQKVVQAVTDAGVTLTGAQFGAFFYTLPDHHGAPLQLYALSGAPRAAFEHYPLPRMTRVFGPTFRGEGIIRSDDITRDARYGHNAPHHGMPEGHLPVRSYLAVPVATRDGDAIGGFFFGHPRPGVFDETAEQVAVSLATQAAIALGNAQLYQDARRSEHRFRSLVEATHQIVWFCAPDGQVTTEQPAWQQFTGQDGPAHLGWGWLDALHPEDRERIRQRWLRAVDTCDVYEVEHRLRRYDGAYRFMRVRAVPVRSEDGSVLEWIGVHEDITDRHEAEEQLVEREARYRALVEHTVVGVTRIDLDGRFIDVNPATATILGYGQSELAGMSVADITYPEDLNVTFSALQRVLTGEQESVTLEKRYVRKDGTLVWSSSGVTAVRKDTGEVEYIIAMINDITERKRAEAELHRLNADLEQRVRARTQDLVQERSFLRALLESLTEGIIACDVDGHLNFVNDAANRMFGLPDTTSPSALNLGRLSRSDGAAPLLREEDPLHRTFNGDVVRDEPFVVIVPDGPNREVNASGNVIAGPDGAKLGAVLALHDVTAQRHAEREVRRVNAELQRSNAELAQFAAVASHDLKAPLRTVVSYLQLFKHRSRGRLDPSAEKLIDVSEQAALRMSSLIEDLLSYAQVGRQRHVQPVDANQVLRDVLSSLDAIIKDSGADVTSTPLPMLLADETQLRQVFQNLIANGLKFQPPGRVPKVHVHANREGVDVHIQVTDNGIGMDPAYSERVFEVFQRLHGQAAYVGNGIGLAVVKKIIEEHGGRVWIESQLDAGTTVHFTLRGS